MNWENGKAKYGVAIGVPDLVEAISTGCFDELAKAEEEAIYLMQSWEEFGYRKPQSAFIFECKLVTVYNV